MNNLRISMLLLSKIFLGIRNQTMYAKRIRAAFVSIMRIGILALGLSTIACAGPKFDDPSEARPRSISGFLVSEWGDSYLYESELEYWKGEDGRRTYLFFPWPIEGSSLEYVMPAHLSLHGSFRSDGVFVVSDNPAEVAQRLLAIDPIGGAPDLRVVHSESRVGVAISLAKSIADALARQDRRSALVAISSAGPGKEPLGSNLDEYLAEWNQDFLPFRSSLIQELATLEQYFQNVGVPDDFVLLEMKFAPQNRELTLACPADLLPSLEGPMLEVVRRELFLSPGRYGCIQFVMNTSSKSLLPR